jgi:hypothetical protein
MPVLKCSARPRSRCHAEGRFPKRPGGRPAPAVGKPPLHYFEANPRCSVRCPKRTAPDALETAHATVAFLNMIRLEADRGDGKGFQFPANDTTPGYIDTTRLAGPLMAVCASVWLCRSCARCPR